MKISAQKNGFIDLTEKQEISAFVEKLNGEDTNFEINLHGCLIGYETSILIEEIARKISSPTVKKVVFLDIEYPFLSEVTLWEWLFKDSSLWDEYNVQSYIDEAKQIIKRALLAKYNIEFSIGSK